MSFALTTAQVLEQQKTVTRRLGWHFLRAGDLLQPVVKGQGLKKGEHVKKIGGPIRVRSVRRQRLNEVTWGDVDREGFPDLDSAAFIEMFCRHNGIKPGDLVTRIEFEYVTKTEPLR